MERTKLIGMISLLFWVDDGVMKAFGWSEIRRCVDREIPTNFPYLILMDWFDFRRE
jgi:hypothetical protein